jgi:hypothetical protein
VVVAIGNHAFPPAMVAGRIERMARPLGDSADRLVVAQRLKPGGFNFALIGGGFEDLGRFPIRRDQRKPARPDGQRLQLCDAIWNFHRPANRRWRRVFQRSGK